MIREIDSAEYVKFLQRNNANKQQVSINPNGEHFGYFEGENLVGVISKNETTNTIRIKGFLVNKKEQNNGIGSKLLEYLLVDNKDMTAFATINSRKLFENADFKVVDEKANNIVFMKREKTNKVIKELDPEIKDLINPSLIELSKIILPLEREDRRLAIKYITDLLRKVR